MGPGAGPPGPAQRLLEPECVFRCPCPFPGLWVLDGLDAWAGLGDHPWPGDFPADEAGEAQWAQWFPQVSRLWPWRIVPESPEGEGGHAATSPSGDCFQLMLRQHLWDLRCPAVRQGHWPRPRGWSGLESENRGTGHVGRDRRGEGGCPRVQAPPHSHRAPPAQRRRRHSRTRPTPCPPSSVRYTLRCEQVCVSSGVADSEALAARPRQRPGRRRGVEGGRREKEPGAGFLPESRGFAR